MPTKSKKGFGIEADIVNIMAPYRLVQFSIDGQSLLFLANSLPLNPRMYPENSPMDSATDAITATHIGDMPRLGAAHTKAMPVTGITTEALPIKLNKKTPKYPADWYSINWSLNFRHTITITNTNNVVDNLINRVSPGTFEMYNFNMDITTMYSFI